MSYKIDEIDYSKNDYIDINNRLSRLARNNIGETSTSLKDLDSEDKALGEKNLQVYGSELVNNLKQINYTFRQLEDYVFVPAKAIKIKGSEKTVGEIRKSTTPPSDDSDDKDYKLEFDFSGVEESKEETELGESKTDEAKTYEAIEEAIEEATSGEPVEGTYDWMNTQFYVNYLVDVKMLNYDQATQLLIQITQILNYLNPMIDSLEGELGDAGSLQLEQMREYKTKLDDLSLKLELRRNELDPLPDYVPPTEDIKDFEKYSEGLKKYTSDILENKLEDSLTKLEDKLEEAGVEIPADGITQPFVEENKDALDEEGLKILSEVEKFVEELFTNVVKKVNTPTESIFTDPSNPNIDDFKSYNFLSSTKTYTPEQLKNKKKSYEEEYERIQKLSDEEDKNRKGTQSPAYKSLLAYQYKLSTEGPKYQTLERLEQGKQAEEQPKKPLIKPSEFPKVVKETQLYESIFKNPRTSLTDLRQSLKALGFSQVNPANYPDKERCIEAFNLYREDIKGLKVGSVYTGSGRYRGGGPKKAKTSKQSKKELLLAQSQPATPAPATPTTTPATPAESKPIILDEDEADELADEKEVEREQITNADLAKKIDKLTTAIQYTNQKSPIPAYQTKIDELMSGLVQFLGRTTVLFISKIKKNIKYLDEDLNKQIYDEIIKFKRNLEILRDYKNKSSMLIKSTLYNQVEKETIGLYNEINNSIRNLSKLKNYTSLESLQGGYFIQSDDSFIRQALNKRFL